jgi:uncharacterized membrane protein (Fun14 family)
VDDARLSFGAGTARRALLLLAGLHTLANAARILLAQEITAAVPEAGAYGQALSLFGLLWTLGHGAGFVWLWAQLRGAARVTICVVVVYQLSLFTLHATFARSSEAAARMGFNLMWAGGAILLTFLLVWLWRRPAQTARV